MKPRIVVVLVALLVPAALSFACSDAVEATADRAYDWTVMEWNTDQGAPTRVTILLEHPDSNVLAGRHDLTDTSRFRVHGQVYHADGTSVDIWGIWDTWDNFQAEGGGYALTGYVVDGKTARMALKAREGAWNGDAGVVQPKDLLGSLELCYCTAYGRRATCVKCGDQTACCLPNPEDMGDVTGLPVPGQAF